MPWARRITLVDMPTAREPDPEEAAVPPEEPEVDAPRAELLLEGAVPLGAPRLGPHLAAMAARMAEVLKVDQTMVNVKVKSGEHLDAIGREEAIAAQAMCMIEAV